MGNATDIALKRQILFCNKQEDAATLGCTLGVARTEFSAKYMPLQGDIEKLEQNCIAAMLQRATGKGMFLTCMTLF